MNLVMMHMEETKRIRMKMRQKTMNEAEDKFRKKEMERKLQVERIEKNKEWRDRKRCENGDTEHFLSEEGSTVTRKCIEWMVRLELKCFSCQQDMSPPLKIYQCEEGHNVCQQCRYQAGGQVGKLIWTLANHSL